MNLIKKGTTSVTRYMKIVSSTDGSPKTGFTVTNFNLAYVRNRATVTNTGAASSLGSTNAAYSSAGAYELDNTNLPGLYRFDWPDAAFATGADKVILGIKGSGIDPAFEEIQLVDFDPNDAVRLGLTALPNANAGAAGGLPTDSTGKTSFNDLAAAGVRSAVGLASANLDTQLAAAVTITAAAIRSALGMSSANLDTQLSTIAGYIDTEVATIVSQTAASAIRSAVGLGSANLDTQLATIVSDISGISAGSGMQLSDTVEGSLTVLKTLRIMLAAVAGKSSLNGAGHRVYRDTTDAKDRIVATVDSGSRSVVTLDGS